jgi:hypothetical protein
MTLCRRSAFCRRVQSACSVSLQRIAQTGARTWQSCQWTRARGIAFGAGIVLAALAVAVSLSTPQLTVWASGPRLRSAL